MKRFGLVFKIWLAMFALVLLVLGLSAIFQWGMIERIYFRQQADRILERGNKFVQDYGALGSRSAIDREVNQLAGELGSSVLVIDQGARVVSWSVNRGMGRMGMGMGGGMHGLGVPFDQSDVKAVLAGNTVVKRGNNPFFGMDVMLVAVPIKKEGAVLIHTPLAPIQANLRAINEAVVYSLLLGIAASILLAFIFSRKVSGPILEINSAARAMSRGDFTQQVPVNSGDELGMLAESINTLSRQLAEKIQTLDKIDATRRSFVASISHELRTPLTIMQGYTEALMDGIAQDEKQREKYLLNIYEETIRLRRLVDDLLDLRRLESGMISMRMERADISEIIESVAGQFKETMTDKNLKVRITLPEERLLARGDPDRLKQVVINLVDNAVRFSPADGAVEIEGKEEGDRVRVLVRDRGPGLAEEERQLVWERFYKLDSSRTARGSGSGLGLAIARQIVDLHGGDIGVESTPGEGSTFWFTVRRY
ncbi:MAG: ATP-binding protein [Bacillota bacterium]